MTGTGGLEEAGGVSCQGIAFSDAGSSSNRCPFRGWALKLRLFLRRGLSADFLQSRRSGSCIGCPRHEELVVVKIAVHQSPDLSRFWPEGRMSALQEDDRHNASDVGVSVRGKPPIARAGARTCPGLAQDRFFVKVQMHAARGAIHDSSGHAVGEFRNHRLDAEMTLDPRLEARDFIGTVRMLQVVERAAI